MLKRTPYPLEVGSTRGQVREHAGYRQKCKLIQKLSKNSVTLQLWFTVKFMNYTADCIIQLTTDKQWLLKHMSGSNGG